MAGPPINANKSRQARSIISATVAFMGHRDKPGGDGLNIATAD
jgi:hypothetical protein